MKGIFQTAAQITKIETLADGGLKLSVYTSQILAPQEEALLFSLRNKEGWFLFKENPFEKEDLHFPEIKTPIRKKSPSQRLRAVLYRLWERTDQSIEFQEFYELWIEKFIAYIKKKLDE